MRKTVLWYNKWWVRVLFVAALIVSLYFGLRKTVTYFNYQEYQKTVIDSLSRLNYSKDSTIVRLTKQKEKVKVVRIAINTKPEEDRIKILEHELEQLKKKQVDVKDSLSPEELDKWLRKFLK